MADVLRDIPHVREQLGGVSRTTVFALFRRGELRSVRVGRRRLVPQSVLDEFIAERLAAQSVSESDD